MAGKSVTREGLAEAVYQRVDVTREHPSDLVDQILETICATLQNGETVKPSSFGVFTLRQTGKRPGRNPKTGVEVPIAPRQVIPSNASPRLKARMNRASSLSSDSNFTTLRAE
jgi:integration host factor subunit alpha